MSDLTNTHTFTNTCHQIIQQLLKKSTCIHNLILSLHLFCILPDHRGAATVFPLIFFFCYEMLPWTSNSNMKTFKETIPESSVQKLNIPFHWTRGRKALVEVGLQQRNQLGWQRQVCISLSQSETIFCFFLSLNWHSVMVKH